MNEERCLNLRTFGDVYLTGKISVNSPIKIFGPKELNQLNKIFNHLRKDGIAVVSGSWEKILDILDYLERKKREFGTGRPPSREERRNPTFRKQSYRWYERHYQNVLSHVMVIAQDDRLSYVEPEIHIPYLLQLLGEAYNANGDLPALVSVSAIQKILLDMRQSHYVPALETSIVSHSNVLQPVSQDTVELFQAGLQQVEQNSDLPKIEILDMGCGCGVLSLLAAQTFCNIDVRITATDVLPEAIATAGINFERFTDEKRMAGCSAVLQTTDSGDLFGPVGDYRFDLIIFNAPWVILPPNSRAEMAICDEDQDTVRSFLSECKEHLKPGGQVILGYSDHSGTEALDNLEAIIRESGLYIENILKKRVQTRSQKRKWETILVYDLQIR